MTVLYISNITDDFLWSEVRKIRWGKIGLYMS